MVLDPLQFKQPLLLDIGSGGFSKDARFTSVDLFTEADIKATMWDIPLPDNSVDGIFSSNALEHISKFEVIPTLREWNRILKYGSKLQVLVPDLEWSCKFWLDMQSTDWALDCIFGNQTHGGEFHKTGFTPKILWDYFVVANPGNWYIAKMEYLKGEIWESEEQSNVEGKVNISANQRMINVEALKLSYEETRDAGEVIRLND